MELSLRAGPGRAPAQSKWQAELAHSENLRRLLAELEREVAYITADNAALRREVNEARLGEVKKCKSGGDHVDLYLKKQPVPPQHVDIKAKVEKVPQRTCAQLQLLSPSPKPKRPADPQEPESPIAPTFTPTPLPRAGSCPLFLSVASDFSDGSPSACDALLLQQWQQQFDRLRGNSDLLSARDLWEVVSRQEHLAYGHSRHPLRTVSKTVRLLYQTYSGDNAKIVSSNSFGDQNLKKAEQHDIAWESMGSLSGQGNEIGLDFEAFAAFLADDDSRCLSEGEGGKAEYLRVALRAECNEYVTEEARKAIAMRQAEDADPRPTGWRALVLETLPPPVIMANAICLGLQSDMESPVWEVLELFFLTFYLLEICLKGCVLGCSRFFRGREAPWNVFDLACIVVSLTDLVYKALQLFAASTQKTTALSVLKFFRLARFARLARIIKSFKSHYFDDLKTMSLGILSGAKVLLWAVVLFFACVFVLGVIMKELVGGASTGEWEEFRNVPSAMFSVFRCLIGDCSAYDGTPLSERMRVTYGARFMIPYILIFLVVNFGLFNLIVAVFIDRVVSISVKAKQQDLGKREREMRAAIEEMLVSLIRGAFSRGSHRANSDSSRGGRGLHFARAWASSGQEEERWRATAEAMQQLRAEKVQITRELFSAWLTDHDVLELLENLEIDTSTKMEIFDVCDVDKSGSLTVDELVNGLMRLRGPISKCDVIAIRLKVRYLTKTLEDIHHMVGA